MHRPRFPVSVFGSTPVHIQVVILDNGTTRDNPFDDLYLKFFRSGSPETI
jgi:hypothetical protein